MRRTNRRKAIKAQEWSLTDLPGSFAQQLISVLSPESKLALRATCKRFQLECDSASGSTLQLRLSARIPSIHSIHAVGMLSRVALLDTAAASRGSISIGCTSPAEQIANALPLLQLARVNNSQASLVELLLHAAPQLPSVELAVSSPTCTVVKRLANLPQLSSLTLTLSHPAWMKACNALGQMTQLQSLVVAGKPLDEAARHGAGCISSSFWEDGIAPLTQLTRLSINPWIKAVPGTGNVTYSSLQRLRQLSVPYSSGKSAMGATAHMLSQLAKHCTQLTSLTLGVHEFNWDVSDLAGMTQLRELELHNPFLKEVWGLQPFTAAHLAPLTAAKQLSSLTISTLRLPLMSDVMQAAGQPAAAAAAAVAGPGGSAAASAALAAAGGPAFADMVNAIAIGAVAAAMRSEAEACSAAAVAAAELQQSAAAAVAEAAGQLPRQLAADNVTAARQTGAAAAAGGSNTTHQAGMAQTDTTAGAAALVANRSIQRSVSGTDTAAAHAPCGAAAVQRKVLQAVAAHIDGLVNPRQQQMPPAAAPAQAHLHTGGGDSVGDEQVRAVRQAALALAAAVAPAAAAAAAGGLVMPAGTAAQLPGQQQQQPAAAVAIPAAAAAMHHGAALGGNNQLAVVAQQIPAVDLAGPAVGFIAVPVVPPPLLLQHVDAGGGVLAAAAAGGSTVMGQQQQHPGPAEIAGRAASAAASAAAALLPQLPLLSSLRRLTVGTTHGRFMSGVSIAAMAPNLTAFEDLSEITKLPPYSTDVLGGLKQLQLLTVNVDTLQLHASASGALTTIKASAAGNSSNSGSSGSKGRGAAVGLQQQQQQQSPDSTHDDEMQQCRRNKCNVNNAEQQQKHPTPSSQQSGSSRCTKQQQQQLQQQRRQSPPPALVDPAAWRSLGGLRCLRLLMLGHVHPELLPAEGGKVLPRIAGITRLELCSAFGGKAEYAATYSIAEDPYLWQEQVGVQELVVDGGVLLGGFFVDAAIAALLKKQLTNLRRLIVARCPDLQMHHLEDAVRRRLAPHIVVKRDCSGVSEAAVVALNEGLCKQYDVVVELVGVEPGEYADKSFTYAIDD